MLNKLIKSLVFGTAIANLMMNSASAQISQYEISAKREKANNREQTQLIGVNPLFKGRSFNFAQTLRNRSQITRIGTSIITQIIKGVFKGTKVYLHNRGSKSSNSWHKKNASYIQLSKTLGGRKQKFDIPESRINARAYGTLRYYIDNVRLSKLNVTQEDDAFKLSLFFESNGTELKGYHTGKFVNFGVHGSHRA